ncbi:alpha-L-rhamnosidase C-terminal domain-containing protein [Dyella sp.]|uniref:alpha-L-rhamnosidase-related protein n=1 Tax=Dyella sp. TaxID=1869338 RepID=UPI002ED0A040
MLLMYGCARRAQSFRWPVAGALAVMLAAAMVLAHADDSDSWQRYVVAPASRHVTPVRVVSEQGDVVDADHLVRGGVTVLRRAGSEAGKRAPVSSVVLDFGKVVVGYPRLSFAGASDNHPGVRLAFSETLQHLSERSDYARSDYAHGPGTDQHAVSGQPSTWLDQGGCEHGRKVCADGLHGFRYLRISLDALPTDTPWATAYGEVRIESVSLDFTAYRGTPASYSGWFECSNPALNRYWYEASYTNELVTDTFRSADVDPREADSRGLDGKLVLHDGAKRDRDPYVGDIAVSGRTTYLTHPAGVAARNVLADLADHQRADGWIPPASIRHYTLPLFDYPLWWVDASWDYILYTGDLDYARNYYRQLVKALDQWYPSVTNSRGLLARGQGNSKDYGDYAFLPRPGEVTYYNALYVMALDHAGAWALALGHPQDAERWRKRAIDVRAAINRYLWDPIAKAYLDTSDGSVRHGQDGNALAVLAGVADASRARDALNYLADHTALPYGNAFMDNDSLVPEGSRRVYAFTSYFDIVARLRSGQVDSALDEITRLYGWMETHDPGVTQWEGIGSQGMPYEAAFTSMAHGWSTGVLPALTNELLGVTPRSPGFSRWSVRPHPGPVAWARGRVPTPHGPLDVRWRNDPGRPLFVLDIRAPMGTQGDVTLPMDHANVEVKLDGNLVWRGADTPQASREGDTIVLHDLTPGLHEITLGS